VGLDSWHKFKRRVGSERLMTQVQETSGF